LYINYWFYVTIKSLQRTVKRVKSIGFVVSDDQIEQLIELVRRNKLRKCILFHVRRTDAFYRYPHTGIQSITRISYHKMGV